MHRYAAIARAMGADPFEVLATAAVRDAQQRRRRSSPALQDAHARRADPHPVRRGGGATLRRPACCAAFPAPTASWPISAAARWRWCGSTRRRARRRAAPCRSASSGWPNAPAATWCGRARSPRRTWQRCRGWPRAPGGTSIWSAARGGRWRASTSRRPAIRSTSSTTTRIGREEARDLTGVIAAASRRTLERMPGAPRRRLDDLPFAAVVLRRVLRATGARAGGVQRQRPARGLVHGPRAAGPARARPAAGGRPRPGARSYGRDPALPPALMAWTEPLFPGETGEPQAAARGGVLDVATSAATTTRNTAPNRPSCACCASRASGSTTTRRAFLALTLALRYEAEPEAPFLATARAAALGRGRTARRCSGCALRLAYTLSAGTPDLLAGTALQRRPQRCSAAGRRQRRVRRRERHAAAGPAGAGAGLAGDHRTRGLRLQSQAGLLHSIACILPTVAQQGDRRADAGLACAEDIGLRRGQAGRRTSGSARHGRGLPGSRRRVAGTRPQRRAGPHR